MTPQQVSPALPHPAKVHCEGQSGQKTAAERAQNRGGAAAPLYHACKLYGVGLILMAMLAAGWAGTLPEMTNQCVATIPANRARTTVGVGEEIRLGVAGAPPGSCAWSASAGSVSNATGTSTVFTAPSNAMTATVTVTLPGGESLRREFTVVEPSGVAHVDLLSVYEFETNETGAGMYCRVYLGPTNVSFYRVELMEVATNAASITGYYANPQNAYNPPEDLRDFQANVWFRINADNSWQHNGEDDGTDYDRAWWADDNPPFDAGGRLSWNYTALWKIGAGPVNKLPASWTQQVLLDWDGTISVKKFGHTVTRGTNNVYTTKK